MSYDVFLVAALEDREMAKLVTRRLRSLKMRVWYDAKSTDDEFDEKEARAVHRSDAMLVLWSENAVKSDFVRAAAGTGYSIKNQPFIQARLDNVVPYEPYSVDDLHDLKGFTSRTNTDGWFEIISLLEDRQDRRDLKEWLLIPTKDNKQQNAWRKAHPADRLAKIGAAPGSQPSAVKAPAAGAATLATGAAALSQAAARSQEAEPADAPKRAAGTTTTGPAAASQATGHTGAATPAAARPTAASAFERPAGGLGTVFMILALIALMFLLAWLFRSLQAPRTQALPPVANAGYLTCPVGTVPASVLKSNLLEPGTVIVE